jgi:KDO2-lipid IV(A) lauroyltransferase
MNENKNSGEAQPQSVGSFGSRLTLGLLHGLSRCPMSVLYGLSDLMAPLLHHVVRYRLRVVRDNLRRCFPEQTDAERRAVERRFYRYFCDLAVEIVKGATISADELMRRVEVCGLEAVEATFADHDFCVCYLGHYCNWEWLTVLPCYLRRGGMTQIYHPMRNAAFDRWFCHNRSRFGAINIPMKQTLRRLLALRAPLQAAKSAKATEAEGTAAEAEGGNNIQGYLLGCIADQLPKAANIHHYTTFLGQRTAVFTGSEEIGRRMNTSYAYARMERLRRGYYRLTFELMDAEALQARGDDFPLTDEFMRLMEQDIRRAPEFWLWTHKRWKR